MKIIAADQPLPSVQANIGAVLDALIGQTAL
jgi:hypothetical protein